MTTQTLSLGSNPVLEIEQVSGDVFLEGWERTELEAQGDSIQIEPSEGSLKISCDGDLKLSMPRATKLTISYIGGDLKAENLDGPMEVTFVGGDAILRNLKGQVFLNGPVGGEIRLENVSRVSTHTQKNDRGTDISDQIRRKVDRTTRRAEQKIRRAETKIKIVERKLHQHAQIRANIDVGRWKWNTAPGSFPPEAANEPISDEERMTILKMLQEKKITSEQADKLLAALEGGE
jgi:hypothetical protein